MIIYVSYFTPKWKFFHHLLTLKLFQTYMSLYELNLYENVGNKTVDNSHWIL